MISFLGVALKISSGEFDCLISELEYGLFQTWSDYSGFTFNYVPHLLSSREEWLRRLLRTKCLQSDDAPCDLVKTIQETRRQVMAAAVKIGSGENWEPYDRYFEVAVSLLGPETILGFFGFWAPATEDIDVLLRFSVQCAVYFEDRPLVLELLRNNHPASGTKSIPSLLHTAIGKGYPRRYMDMWADNLDRGIVAQPPPEISKHVAERRQEFVRFLVREASEALMVNSQDHRCFTALHLATLHGFEDTVQLLLTDQEVDPNLADIYNRTPLMYAAYYARPETVRMMLSRDDVNVNHRDEDYITALDLAATSCNLEMARCLLASGRADPNGQGPQGWTPVIRMVKKGDTKRSESMKEIVRLFAGAGANLNFSTGHAGILVNALIVATERGLKDVVLTLIDCGADINCPEGAPLDTAAAQGADEMVQLLLAHGADVSLVSTKHDSALCSACYSGKYSTVDLLLRNGADPNLRGDDRYTPLEEAVNRKDLEMVKLLVRNGADINAPGSSAVEISRELDGAESIQEFLLAQGAEAS